MLLRRISHLNKTRKIRMNTGNKFVFVNGYANFEVDRLHVIFHSGGGTCRNRALGDTFLKFGMVLEQAMRFSKTTGYKLAHATGGCSCEKNKTAKNGHQICHASASMDCSFKYNTNFVLFFSMGNGCWCFMLNVIVTEVQLLR